MGALTIAFDITIVGALALPWVYLVVHLFFSDGENRLKQALDWVNKHQAQVPAGILLFAMTYTLGSAVSRIAYDFFNDDDIHFTIGGYPYGHVLRWPVTEDRIRAHIYCDGDRKDLLPAIGQGTSALTREIRDFDQQKSFCGLTLRAWVCLNGKKGLDCGKSETTDSVKSGPDAAGQKSLPDNAVQGSAVQGSAVQDNAGQDNAVPNERKHPDKRKHPDDLLVTTVTDIFGLQENTLMDTGGDYSARLRQLHDQIMVLRGAAFNGLIAFSLCLFAWGVVLSDNPGCNGKSNAKSSNDKSSHDKSSNEKSKDKSNAGEKPRPWVRWVVMVVPLLYFVAGLVALYHHLHDERFLPPDPPYMEFTLLLLAGAGRWVLWPPAPKSLRHTGEAGAKQAKDNESEKEKETATTPHWRIERWGRLVTLSLILTLAAFLGWWSTEVMYRDQIIYSFDSQFADTQGATAPKK